MTVTIDEIKNNTEDIAENVVNKLAVDTSHWRNRSIYYANKDQLSYKDTEWAHRLSVSKEWRRNVR